MHLKHQFTDQLCIGSMEGSTPYRAQQNTNQERHETMSLQVNEVAPDFDATHFERVRPDLLDLVQGTTACSSTVFYGLLAWANLHAHKPSKAQITTVALRQAIGSYRDSPTSHRGLQGKKRTASWP